MEISELQRMYNEEHAERVAAENEVAGLKLHLVSAERALNDAQAEIAILRKALRFYAKGDNYAVSEENEFQSDVAFDSGRIARAALEGKE